MATSVDAHCESCKSSEEQSILDTAVDLRQGINDIPSHQFDDHGCRLYVISAECIPLLHDSDSSKNDNSLQGGSLQSCRKQDEGKLEIIDLMSTNSDEYGMLVINLKH